MSHMFCGIRWGTSESSPVNFAEALIINLSLAWSRGNGRGFTCDRLLELL